MPHHGANPKARIQRQKRHKGSKHDGNSGPASELFPLPHDTPAGGCPGGDQPVDARLGFRVGVPLLPHLFAVFRRDHAGADLVLSPCGVAAAHDLARPDIHRGADLCRRRHSGRHCAARAALSAGDVPGPALFVRAFRSAGPAMGAGAGGLSAVQLLAVLDPPSGALQ